MNEQDDRAEPLGLFFDESGFTGPRLLDPSQPVFSYASVAITDAEAAEILWRARDRYPVQMSELKASELLGTSKGVALISDVLESIEGRYSFIVQNKLLVLCGKVFEYLFEPVFQHDPSILYRKNLHRFVAMYCFIFSQSPDGAEMIRQFERFMRTLDPNEAPMLFEPATLTKLSDSDPFKMIVKFAQGYRDVIVSDNQRMLVEMSDQGKWALDVSIAGLWSLLNYWGEAGRPLRVVCDDSKPLPAQVEHFTGDINDPGIARAVAISRRDEPFGWELEGPIAFGDSRSHPGLQIADLIAGAASRMAIQEPIDGDAALRACLQRHIHRHSIVPDFDQIELGTRQVDVNWLVLMELGDRAALGLDPYDGLEKFYAAAEETWRPNLLAG